MFTFKPITAVFLLAWLIILVSVSACSAPRIKDYQWGDISAFTVREVAQLKKSVNDYCAKNSESRVRKVALFLIRLKFPLIPEEGICSDFEVLNDVKRVDSLIKTLHKETRIRGDP